MIGTRHDIELGAAALALILIAIAATTCRTRGFILTDADYAEFYRDLRECEQENMPDWYVCQGAFACRTVTERRNQCMMARGWQLPRAAEADRP